MSDACVDAKRKTWTHVHRYRDGQTRTNMDMPAQTLRGVYEWTSQKQTETHRHTDTILTDGFLQEVHTSCAGTHMQMHTDTSWCTDVHNCIDAPILVLICDAHTHISKDTWSSMYPQTHAHTHTQRHAQGHGPACSGIASRS